MDVFKAEKDLRKVELCLRFSEETLVLEQVEELAARTEVNDEVQVVFWVESCEKLDDEWMVIEPLHDF